MTLIEAILLIIMTLLIIITFIIYGALDLINQNIMEMHKTLKTKR